MAKVFSVFREFGRSLLSSVQGGAWLGPRHCPGHGGQHTLVRRAGGRGTLALAVSQRAGCWPRPQPTFPQDPAPLAVHLGSTGGCKMDKACAGDRGTLPPPWALASRTRGLLRPLPPPPSPEPRPDNQMAVIISVVAVLLFLFVASILLCFVLGQHWRQRRMGAYGVQDA